MLINGKEIGFYVTVWAFTELSDWLVENQDKSSTRATLQKALIYNEAFIRAGKGGDKLTPEDFEDLPIKEFFEIKNAIEAQEKADMGTTVETKPGKKTGNPVK